MTTSATDSLQCNQQNHSRHHTPYLFRTGQHVLLQPATRDPQMPAGVFDVADMQLLLRWLDMLARNPKGTDDVKAVTGVLPPVQKLVLQLLEQLNMVRGACAGRAAMLALFSLQSLSCWPVCCSLCSKLLGSMASPQLQWSLAPALRTGSSSKRLGFCAVCSPSCCTVLCCAGVCCTQALLPDAWPDMLRTLAAFLCPFRAMMQQRQQEAMAAAAAAAAAASGAAAAGGGSGADAASLRTPWDAGAAVPSTPQTAGSLGGARSFNRCVLLEVGFVWLSSVRPVTASLSRAASASASRGGALDRCVAADGLFAVCGLPCLLRAPPLDNCQAVFCKAWRPRPRGCDGCSSADHSVDGQGRKTPGGAVCSCALAGVCAGRVLCCWSCAF